jgi:hypothetical protein
MSDGLPFDVGHKTRGPGRDRPRAWVWVLVAATMMYAALAGGVLIVAALALRG